MLQVCWIYGDNEMIKRKIRIKKCYYVTVEDEDGNTLDSDYIFSNRKDAERAGRNMRENAINVEKKRLEELKNQLSFEDIFKKRTAIRKHK